MRVDCEETDEPDALLQKTVEAQAFLIRSANRKFADPAMDMDNIVPRKGNWDMKRSLAPKLERLELRTKKALVELVREERDKESKSFGPGDDVRSISSEDQ